VIPFRYARLDLALNSCGYLALCSRGGRGGKKAAAAIAIAKSKPPPTKDPNALVVPLGSCADMIVRFNLFARALQIVSSHSPCGLFDDLFVLLCSKEEFLPSVTLRLLVGKRPDLAIRLVSDAFGICCVLSLPHVR
jgi:hypothetical protein